MPVNMWVEMLDLSTSLLLIFVNPINLKDVEVEVAAVVAASEMETDDPGEEEEAPGEEIPTRTAFYQL
jgi:hypothetical protein